MKPRRVVHGYEWAHLAPPTYTEVMREAGDNGLIAEPTQPAAEHDLPEEVRRQMPRYEVELQIEATAWVDVEAYDEAEAIDAAKDVTLLSDCQWWQVSDASVKRYSDKADGT